MMNKVEWIEQTARVANLSVSDSESALRAGLRCIEDALSRGERVHLAGFGVFDIEFYRSRIGREPQTGAAIPIPSRIKPVFRPAKHLTETVARHVEVPDN